MKEGAPRCDSVPFWAPTDEEAARGLLPVSTVVSNPASPRSVYRHLPDG